MLINLPFAKLTLILAAVVASVPACAAVGSSGSNDEERQVFPRLRTIQTRQQISSSAAEKTGAPQQISSSVPEKTEAPQQDTVEILMEQMLLMSMDTTIDPTTDLPSAPPSDSPTESPTGSPTELVTMGPTTAATALATGAPSVVASEPIITTLAPTQGDATVIDTEIPSVTPSLRPTDAPTGTPPTLTPTVEGCGISADVRRQQILALLDSVADPDLIRDDSTTLGQATTWLLENDPRKICPGVPKILQRWVLAVLYFSTGGDEWFQCSANLLADDPCGFEEPFASPQKQRFLSGFNECEWAGITCDEELCVTEIEFELNNVAGIIPTEIGLLTDLERWGMERGNLTGTIPTEIASLSKLTFLDFDFNQLTGSLTTQLLSLNLLEQLDLNDNNFSGSINGIGVFPSMKFLQLHRNGFTGTVPVQVGDFTNLTVFTLHATQISGEMPNSVCGLLETEGGFLTSLIADCEGNAPDIVCDCCTDCRDLNGDRVQGGGRMLQDYDEIEDEEGNLLVDDIISE